MDSTPVVLIDAQTLFKTNRFTPPHSDEDLDRLRRFGLVSEVADTRYLVGYVVRREEGSTTDFGKHQSGTSGNSIG